MSEFVSPEDGRYDERERQLVRIGEEAIAVGDEPKLNAYFADDYNSAAPTGRSTSSRSRRFLPLCVLPLLISSASVERLLAEAT